MWTSFENWLASQLEFMLSFIGRSLSGFWSAASAGTLVFWGKILAVVGWVWVIMQFAGSLLTIIWNSVQSLADPVVLAHLNLHVPSDVVSCFSIANTFLPLDTMAQVLAAYFSWSVSLGLYRFVKSWLPVVGSEK